MLLAGCFHVYTFRCHSLEDTKTNETILHDVAETDYAFDVPRCLRGSPISVAILICHTLLKEDIMLCHTVYIYIF